MPLKINCKYVYENTGTPVAPAPLVPRKSVPSDGDSAQMLEPAFAIECTQHPSLTLALESLDMYERWVSGVVLPIAFEWIYEHPEICDGLDETLKDDVGVVIAAAFDRVLKSPHYLDGQREFANFKLGKKLVRPVNPVWGKTSRELREDTLQAYQAQTKVLKDAVCA